MGSGSWSPSDWAAHSSTVKHAREADLFTSRTIKTDLDPKGVAIRESRDSTEHPESNAIIIALDVTGSMGHIATTIAKEGLGVLFQEILDRKPVSDPQLMFMAAGDAPSGDRYPLQVSQFESDNRIIEQLTSIYIEHGGGGNSTESYDLPWYFAGTHTSIDCWEKRQKKGYLFTIGDEKAPAGLSTEDIRRVIGDEVQADLSASQLLAMAERMYNVYHIIITEGNGVRCMGRDEVIESWTNLIGQRAVPLDDHTKLAELIISLIQINEGARKEDVVSSWDGSTSLVISKAVKDVIVDGATVSSTGLVTL